jgi:methylmalonyl-CoA mutase N-terminal domain/subunit
VEILRLDPAIEREQVERLRKIKASRSQEEVARHLAHIRRAAERGENLVPVLIEAAEARVSVGEAMQALADVFGRYERPPTW